jgi:hypothetical protein
MPNLKYVGASHYREISKADFQSLGVEDQGAIRVAGESALVRNHDYKTPQVVELTEDAADALLDVEPDDWEETDEPAEPPLKARAEARRLARAAAKEERELAKANADANTSSDAAGKAGSGDAGDGNTGGAGKSSGRSTRSR